MDGVREDVFKLNTVPDNTQGSLVPVRVGPTPRRIRVRRDGGPGSTVSFDSHVYQGRPRRGIPRVPGFRYTSHGWGECVHPFGVVSLSPSKGRNSRGQGTPLCCVRLCRLLLCLDRRPTSLCVDHRVSFPTRTFDVLPRQ